jgi:hypothetical protein
MEDLDRIACAFERIADSLEEWCKLNQARFEREFPIKPEPKDATITHIPTTEDELRSSQGAGEEDLSTWTSDVGVREQAIIDRSQQGSKASLAKSRTTSKRLPPEKRKGQ